MDDKTPQQPYHKPPENLEDSTLGQYQVLEEIGRGGMATVYRAVQTSMKRDVALKVLPPAFLHDPSFYERFEREVDVVAHLEHPHIVPIYDFGEEGGMPYIAMRLLTGGSLRSIIQSGHPELRDLIQPVRQIASALDYAHAQGIVHRDLKPGNILRDNSGNSYLSDFGIARVLNSDLTGSSIIGTPAYMSPEQANGDMLDARSDIYSLGIVIFELITGREPFTASTPIAMILKHLNERVPYLSEFRDNVPEEVNKVIAKATEKVAKDRYSSAGAMAEAFEDAVRGTASTVSLPTVPIPEHQFTTETLVDDFHPTPLMTEEEQQLIKEASKPSAPKPPARERLTAAQATANPDSEPAQEAEKPKRRGSLQTRVIISGVALTAAVAIFAAFGSNLTSTAAVTAPTPFAAASVFTSNHYSVTIPDNWSYEDASNAERIYQRWQDEAQTLAVAVAIGEAQDAENLATAVEEYVATYYAELDGFEEIVESSETAENGVMRKSYRIENSADLANGQMDVFFDLDGGRLSIIEFYSADETGNELVALFQQILDSFRLIA